MNLDTQNFDTNGAADYLKSLGVCFSPGTLNLWRCKGKGPRFRKISGKVVYPKSALDEFVLGAN
jgi:hypothetical protein